MKRKNKIFFVEFWEKICALCTKKKGFFGCFWALVFRAENGKGKFGLPAKEGVGGDKKMPWHVAQKTAFLRFNSLRLGKWNLLCGFCKNNVCRNCFGKVAQTLANTGFLLFLGIRYKRKFLDRKTSLWYDIGMNHSALLAS